MWRIIIVCHWAGMPWTVLSVFTVATRHGRPVPALQKVDGPHKLGNNTAHTTARRHAIIIYLYIREMLRTLPSCPSSSAL